MPTIRADLKTRDTVRRLAADMGITMQEVLHLAAKAYEEELDRRAAREQAWALRQRPGRSGEGSGPEDGT